MLLLDVDAGATTDVMATVFEKLGTWITGIFGAIGDLLEGISTGNEILLGFVILMPLMGIAMGYLMKFLGKKRRRR